MTGQGDRVKFIRGALTQKEFAKRLGITAQAVINYERYGRVPSKAVLNKILNVYSINPEWLLTGEGEMYAEVPEGVSVDIETANALAVLKDKNQQPPDFTGSRSTETANALAVLRLTEQNLVLQRELLEVTRQNGDLRVQVERLRMDVERRNARIAELERQLAEALNPPGGQALLDKRNAAAG